MAVTDSEVPRRTLRRQREKEQRVATILGAAETLFARKGFQQTSIEEIADMAEVSTGTIYFYFKNKEDLLIKAMYDIAFQLRKTLGDGLEKSDYSFEGFCRVGQDFLQEFCLRHPEKAVILFRESVGMSPDVEEHRKILFEKLTGDLKGAIEKVGLHEGSSPIPDHLAELAAVLTVGIYAQVAYHYLIWHDGADDIADISNQTISFLIAGIGNLLASGWETQPGQTSGPGAA